uniref:F-box domain-containing protein n=1 Tax=Caenorhabditis tropicalis TaxID=1561998 RepID=A0A1I7UVA8_9PELO
MEIFRLPLLPLIEVFKNMDFREKFLISLLSKRARNILRINSRSSEFSIDFSEELRISLRPNNSYRRSIVSDEVFDCLVSGEVLELKFSSVGVVLREQSPQKQLLLANYVLDTFKKPPIHVLFEGSTPPTFVLEFMKMINQKKLPIKSITLYIYSKSSELTSRILDECTGVTDTISIHSEFPNDLVYTPPRPFKATTLIVIESTNWVNLESFMSCQRIYLNLGMHSNRTPQSWNTFFRNWIDSDSPLENLSCVSGDKPINFPLMVDGLSNEGIKKRWTTDEWIDVKRRNGSEFVISRDSHYFHIWTKQEHLEHLRNQEQNSRFR